MGKCILACCSDEIMRQALRIYRRVLERCDVLVVLSCSTGVQTAMLCEPDLPVSSVLDTVGSAVITRRDDHPLSRSTCSMCGHCVLAYTGETCPLDGCPAGMLYQPCDDYPREGDRCSLDPHRECVWKGIEERGDPVALQEVKCLHEEEDIAGLAGPAARTTPPFLRRMIGWGAVRLSGAGLGRFISWIN